MKKRLLAIVILFMMIISTVRVDGLEVIENNNSSVQTTEKNELEESKVNEKKEESEGVVAEEKKEENQNQNPENYQDENSNKIENNENTQSNDVSKNENTVNQISDTSTPESTKQFSQQDQDNSTNTDTQNEQNSIIQKSEIKAGSFETEVNENETEVKIILKDTDISGIGKEIQFAVWSDE
ncbi:hypothetical protein H5999_11965, partial [[Clostridium] spiroforme]|nr:hypothetical protein [Thomasclavelia spiroformis]